MTKIRFTIEFDFADGACAERIHDDVNVYLTEGLHDLLRSYGQPVRSLRTSGDLYGALTTEEVMDEAVEQTAEEALEEVGFFSSVGDDYADHEVAITYPTTCGPSPRTVVTSNRRHFRKHLSDMTDDVWACVQQALSVGLCPASADTDGGMVGRVSFLPITKGAAVVRIHDRHADHDGVLSYIAASVYDCQCLLSRSAYTSALEQGDTITMGCITAEPVRSAQGGAA
jgi:hypothetical protein